MAAITSEAVVPDAVVSEKKVPRQRKVLTGDDVQALLSAGRKPVIYNGNVMLLDKWQHQHPGGILVIEHMLGRDATDEINAYHSAETLARMKAFSVGVTPSDTPWVNLSPPIQASPGPNVEDVLKAKREKEEALIAAALEKATAADVPASRDSLTTCSESRKKGACRSRVNSPTLAEQAPPVPAPVHVMTEKMDASKTSRSEFIHAAETREIEIDLASFPALDGATQAYIASRYRALHDSVKNNGLYDCYYRNYAKECVRYALLFSAFWFLLRLEWYLTSAVCLGLFWHQIMFTAHDAGHLAITHNFVIDSLIGMFIADFCCGLSLGWWKSSHNVHHLVTNHPEHDPDIQNAPLLATSPSFFRSISSSYYAGFVFQWDGAADVIAALQKYTYYPIMGIARFNLYLLSWIHLLRANRSSLGAARWTRPCEIVFMACYWYIFGYRLLLCTLPSWPIRIAFVLISHIATFPLHIQITLSHFAMSTADLGPKESFAQRQLRTTMDVDCPAWLDWIHGGLQFQAIHHLFPRVPRHNLRQVQQLVRGFCDETGIGYQCLGFGEGNRKVVGRLGEVGRQVEFLRRCEREVRTKGILEEVY